MPTGFLVVVVVASPKRSAAAGPSVATTTLRPVKTTTSSSSSPLWATTATLSSSPRHRRSIPPALQFRWTDPLGSLDSSCLGTAPIPPAGKQLDPVASIFITNSKSLDVVPRLLSKKIPPKKGLKKVRTTWSENPTSLKCLAIVVSLEEKTTCRGLR